MKLTIKSVLAGAAVLVLFGCSGPVAKINQNCRASGETATACDCFTQQLEQKLTPEQLNAVAASMDKNRQANATPEEAQALQQQLGMEGAVTVMGAGKQCGLTGIQQP
jgi:hypothetical protein